MRQNHSRAEGAPAPEAAGIARWSRHTGPPGGWPPPDHVTESAQLLPWGSPGTEAPHKKPAPHVMATTPKERAGRPEEGLSPKGSVSVYEWPGERGLVSVTRLPGGCSGFLPAQTKGWNRTEMITHVEKRARKQTLAAPSADGRVSARSAPCPPQTSFLPIFAELTSTRAWLRKTRGKAGLPSVASSLSGPAPVDVTSDSS